MCGVLDNVGMGSDDCAASLLRQPGGPLLLDRIVLQYVLISPVGEGHYEIGPCRLCLADGGFDIFSAHSKYVRRRRFRPDVCSVGKIDQGNTQSPFLQQQRLASDSGIAGSD